MILEPVGGQGKRQHCGPHAAGCRYRRLLLKDKTTLVQLEEEAAGRVKVRCTAAPAPVDTWRCRDTCVQQAWARAAR